MPEHWRPIKGYEGLYAISDQGRVRSLPRVVPYRNSVNRKIKGQFLRVGIGSNGYPLVSLWKLNKGMSVYVHSLILNAFRKRPSWAQTCNHKNYDRADNRLANLEWVTYRQNNIHSYKSGHHGRLKENQNGNPGTSQHSAYATAARQKS